MRPRLSGAGRRTRSVAVGLAHACAVVFALAACKARPIDEAGIPVDTAAEPDTQKAPPSASADKEYPTEAAAEPCELKRELTTWSDSSLVVRRYGDFAVLQLALTEVEPLLQPPATGLSPTSDSAAIARVCVATQSRELGTFLDAYRRFAVTSALTRAFVGKLGQVGPAIAASARDTSNPADTVGGDSASPVGSVNEGGELPEAPANHRVEVPRNWLAALLAILVIVGGILVYALWRLGWMITDSERQLRDSHHRHSQGVGEKIEQSTRSLREEAGQTQKTTLVETENYFKRVSSEIAMLREQLLGNGGGSGGGVTTGGAPDRDRLARQYGNPEWEEARVDVRSSDGGSASIHADPYGVFTLRWVRNSGGQARLSVNPESTLGAAFNDRLNAAFNSQGVSSGSGLYRTVEEAICSWDPSTSQGRINHRGLVEEV